MSDDVKQTACFYALGLLPAHEEEAFERDMAASPELQELVRSLHNALVAIARSAPAAAPPPALRDRILHSLNPAQSAPPQDTPQQNAPSRDAPPESAPPAARPETAPAASPVSPAERRPVRMLTWIPWAAAAVIAFAGIYAWRVRMQSIDTAAMNQYLVKQNEALAESLKSEKAGRELYDAGWKKALDDAAEAIRARMALEKQVQQAKEQLAIALQQVTDLQKLATIDQARIAVLNSKIKNRPDAVAVSIWNQAQQDGVLVVENLPVLPKGRDYQLWVIDPRAGGPVSAGVFKVDPKGRVRMQFKPAKPILQADKFAITSEQEGGVVSPTMANMVVIEN